MGWESGGLWGQDLGVVVLVRHGRSKGGERRLVRTLGFQSHLSLPQTHWVT